MEGGKHDLRFEAEPGKLRSGRGSQRLDINGVVVIGRRDPHRRLMAHAREHTKDLVAHRRRCRRAVLRIKRDDENALAALADESCER